MKKIMYLFVMVFVLGTAALFAQDEVKVIRAASFDMGKYGYSWTNRSYTMLVKNIAYEKNVTIHGETEEGEWKDYPARYIRSCGDNMEIWEVHVNEGPVNFVAKYEVNGETYWDNNNGENYTISSEGITLYNDINILSWGTSALYESSQTMYVGVNLKNFDYNKDVKVVYTTDNWETRQEAELHYSYYQSYGYGTADSPNEAGFEYWYSYIQVDPTVSTIEYAIRYEVNGQVYWDNNFGSNYYVVRR